MSLTLQMGAEQPRGRDRGQEGMEGVARGHSGPDAMRDKETDNAEQIRQAKSLQRTRVTRVFVRLVRLTGKLKIQFMSLFLIFGMG